MFPRPSRFLRLLIFLLIFIFIAVSMYVITPDLSASNIKQGQRAKMVAYGATSFSLAIPSRKYGRESQFIPERNRNVGNGTNKHVEEPDFDTHIREQIMKGRALWSTHTEEPAESHIKEQNNLANPHNFAYIHNPSSLCHKKVVTLFIYIHSSPDNLKKRQAVRQTWGHPKLLSLYNATMVFILGRVQDPTVQALVDMEAAQYGDIVQEDFVDSYRNLTHKGVAGLKWAVKFCKEADFLLKTDDDILLDIVSLMDNLFSRVLREKKSRTRLVLCNLWTRMKVIRDPKSKWFIAKEDFPEEYFPAYCSGSAFLLSADLAPALYNTALNTPFFWVDDYYITGMLVNKLKIQHTRFNAAYLLNYNVAEEKLRNDTHILMVFHVKKLSLFLKLWPTIMQRHKGMEKYLAAQTFSAPKYYLQVKSHVQSQDNTTRAVKKGTEITENKNVNKTSIHHSKSHQAVVQSIK